MTTHAYWIAARGFLNETENKVTNKFKAGDRVRLTGSEWTGLGFSPQAVVTIIEIDEDGDPYFEDGVEGEEYRFYIFNNDQYSAELVTDHQGEYVAPTVSSADVENLATSMNGYSFQKSVEAVTSAIASMLIAKNKAYGNSALDPIRTFSKANAREQLLVRIDDKLSRIARGHDFPNEDTVDDLIGYLVLLKIAGNGDD